MQQSQGKNELDELIRNLQAEGCIEITLDRLEQEVKELRDAVVGETEALLVCLYHSLLCVDISCTFLPEGVMQNNWEQPAHRRWLEKFRAFRRSCELSEEDAKTVLPVFGWIVSKYEWMDDLLIRAVTKLVNEHFLITRSRNEKSNRIGNSNTDDISAD